MNIHCQILLYLSKVIILSKVSSCEKFYISKIVQGLESLKHAAGNSEIQMLLSDSLHENKAFNTLIENVLEISYKNDCAISKEAARNEWNEHFIKIYKGRDITLKSIIIKWYPGHERPGFLDRIKSLFMNKFND